MATQNNAPAGGMRDFLPVEAGRRQAVIHTIQEVYRTWGFLPLETPALERLATLQGKYGEEGENLMYKVLKRGAKLDKALASDPRPDDLADMGLRYDLTVPLARVMAAHQADLPAIFKRYQIQSVFRADRPARGRYREFSQCDVDIVGVAGGDAEADVLGAAAESLHRLGFKQPDDFTLRLNHRQVLAGLLARAGIPEHLAGDAMVAIDKADKIGLDGVRRELVERGIASTAGNAFLTMAADMSDLATTEDLLALLEGWLDDFGTARDGVADLKRLTDLLEAGPAAGRYRIDPLLARGLGYYTGAIYEVQFPDFPGSGGGGGRYDNLLGMFSGRTVPACGFSFGLERILLIMADRAMFGEGMERGPQVLAAQMDAAVAGHVHRAANLLREAGLRTDLYPAAGRLGRQFRYAESQGIRFVVLAGTSEAEAGELSVKDLETGEQTTLPLADAVARLRALLD
ncbi:MAG: histidine--tRNA ligase [Caldilineaceae bacterium]|nr:histidine--tRNA ligase [Caldilineaceae bacterium]